MCAYQPRLSHFELFTDAYTPKRTKYNAYLVFGLGSTLLAYEVIFYYLMVIKLIFYSFLD